MSNENMPHSGHYFGDQRDFWWNYDFVALMAKRWDLNKIHSVLDVGCGIGHWGLTLAPFLPEKTNIVGIDPEIAWVKKATQRAQSKTFNHSFHYQIGTAENLPFEDSTFDMVTCQTLLIHVADPSIALKEMIRVLKPGGLLAVAEPNNIAPMLVFDNISVDDPIGPLLDYIRFNITCERGKKALGLGYNSVGDILPFAFSKQNLNDIQVYLSDKTSPLIPPYQSPQEKIWLEQIEDWKNQEILTWPREETERYYLAGGGTHAEFEQMWPILIQHSKDNLKNIQNKTLSSIGTTIMYLISGRKK